MACSKAHGPQAFVRYVKDKTGEAITQQDWHDVRQMAQKQGSDMSREQVSAQEAIASLKALSARIKADEADSKKSKEKPKTADEIVAEMLAEREDGWARMQADFETKMAANREAMVRPADTAPQAASTPAPAHSREAEAEDDLLAAKVTRGTVAVIKFFSTYGVKPVLAFVRAKREEQKRLKKAQKFVDRHAKATRGW